MKKVDLIVKNAYLVTVNKDREVISDACIVVENDKILEIGGNELLEKYSAEKVIDAKNKFVFPGFVNMHSHLFQNVLKGFGRDKKLLEWLDSSVRKAWFRYDKDFYYYTALAGCIEAIKTGTTTILDYMYLHNHPQADDFVIQALEDIGIRGVYGRGFSGSPDVPDYLENAHIDTERIFFDDIRRLEKKYRNHETISIAIAPGIIWYSSDDDYREMRSLADELKLPITMHLVETIDDDEICESVRKMRTIPYLEKMGLLGPDLIAVHSVYMEEEDKALFKKHDVKICHCPIANMILASGVAPIAEFVEDGLTVCLATDGSASNDTQNMLEVMKMTTLLQKVANRDANLIPASMVLEMATINGAKSLNMLDKIGSIEVGKKADFIIYNPSSPFTMPVNDPISTLVYSSSPENIETSVINGRVVMENRKITTIDEEKVMKIMQSLANRLKREEGMGNMQWGRKIENFGLEEEGVLSYE